MRSASFALVFSVLLFSVPSWSRQMPQAASTTQASSDSQAVAVVQAAITALGGATTIGQAQSWKFQAQMQGPQANGPVEYSISTDTGIGTTKLANGATKFAPATHSYFIPALVGAILLKESQDPQFSILDAGSSTVDSKPVTVIVFAIGQMKFPAQTWYFDATNLPVQIDFKFPAEIGARNSFPAVVLLSGYQGVSGVQYPFQIISIMPGRPAEIIKLHSVSTSATASPNDFNSSGGDLP
jgi:hypothetical protein